MSVHSRPGAAVIGLLAGLLLALKTSNLIYMLPLLAWLVGKPVEDLMIGRPDLETLFKRYYERGPA